MDAGIVLSRAARLQFQTHERMACKITKEEYYGDILLRICVKTFLREYSLSA